MELFTLVAIGAAIAGAEIYAAHAARSASSRTAAVLEAVADYTQQAAASAEARAEHAPDADLLERLEAVERRVEGAQDDIKRRLKNLAQERRRLEKAAARTYDEDDDDDEDDELPILGEIFGRPADRTDNRGARRRLKRR